MYEKVNPQHPDKVADRIAQTKASLYSIPLEEAAAH